MSIDTPQRDWEDRVDGERNKWALSGAIPNELKGYVLKSGETLEDMLPLDRDGPQDVPMDGPLIRGRRFDPQEEFVGAQLYGRQFFQEGPFYDFAYQCRDCGSTVIGQPPNPRKLKILTERGHLAGVDFECKVCKKVMYRIGFKGQTPAPPLKLLPTND